MFTKSLLGKSSVVSFLFLAGLQACAASGANGGGQLPQNQVTTFNSPNADAGVAVGNVPTQGGAVAVTANALQGSVGGKNFAPQSATYTSTGTTLAVDMWQAAGACAQQQAAALPVGGLLQIQLSPTQGQLRPGTYVVDGGDRGANVGSASLTFNILSATCQATVGGSAGDAQSGTITLLTVPSAQSASATGTFVVVTRSGDTLSGSFVASGCVAPQSTHCAGTPPAATPVVTTPVAATPVAAVPIPAAATPVPATPVVSVPATTIPTEGTTTPAPGTTTPATGTTTPAPGTTTPAAGTTTPTTGSTAPATGATTPATGMTTPATGTSTPATAATMPTASATGSVDSMTAQVG